MMAKELLGFAWLQTYYRLKGYKLKHRSYVGAGGGTAYAGTSAVSDVFSPRYAPRSENPLDHVIFALKYDALDLDFLKAVLERIPVRDIKEYITEKPTGRYARRIGYLYEFLTGKLLDIPDVPRGSYVDLLDESKYLTGKIVKNTRWHLNDNLLGVRDFCPVIRKTPDLKSTLQDDYRGMFLKLEQSFPPDIFRRATNYLYTKETRSSYQIEHEKPTPARISRFVTLLEQAGKEPLDHLLDETYLTWLQNKIVDPRYAASGFRGYQNYIGQTLWNYEEQVHYVCPPPVLLSSLMKGLLSASKKCENTPALIRAVVLSFGFVFAHPFEDGNGRLHRFLIHDMLARSGVVPQGKIIPVSAHMLNQLRAYDDALESYSMPLMSRIQYHKTERQELVVENPAEVAGYYRYPDLTVQAVYLGSVIRETIESDMPGEILFLQRYDEVKAALQEIADIPDKELDLIILFLHQNNGQLPRRRRKRFSKLTDEELEEMQTVFREVFELNP